jgi:predicted phage baseplate assembly protein
MPLPIPNLDDRRFDDLVAEATARIEAHTPEWSNIAPGDPGSALIDLFAWLTETILYRQNLIPLRQRRAFMNLLSIPLRPAAPATGLVCLYRSRPPSPPGKRLSPPAPRPSPRRVISNRRRCSSCQ